MYNEYIIKNKTKEHIMKEKFETTLEYKVYFGLFDQLTHKQEIRTADALEMVSDYIANHFSGATVYSGYGVYRHEDGSTVKEPSLIVELLDVKFDDVVNMINEIKYGLNQESVLISEAEIKYQFA